ncbi:MAG TPA: hypothetical protein VGX50_16145 [Longimicrobium sp.]|jgi:hypothetical protein|nr:hypothetical protein [Longimicrobium sp.]
MIRILLISLLLGAAPLAAQIPTGDVPPLRSGTRVRVFMPQGPPAGATGLLVSGTRDTLWIAFPVLGLMRLSAADLQRLEAAPMTGPTWKYTAIDPRLGLPEVQQTPGLPGAPVRIMAGAQPRSVQRLHGFTVDSLYLFREGRSTAVARADIRSLQVSMQRDRRRGVMLGAPIGAVAGGVVALNALQNADEGSYLSIPSGAVFGGGLGWLLGAAAGWVFAPRKWEPVPVHGPRR